MCTSMFVSIAANTMRELLDFHAEHGCERDPAELVDMAIREWLERQRDPTTPQRPKGYLWKTVLLPNGARLRISSHNCLHYAFRLRYAAAAQARRAAAHATPGRFAQPKESAAETRFSGC